MVKSGACALGRAAVPLACALKPVVAKVGKKLIKIGIHTLKDWAQNKSINDAVQENLRCAGIETANEIEQSVDGTPPVIEPETQEGSGK